MGEQGGTILRLGVGVASETGQRRRNEDFAGAALPPALPRDRQGLALALADGMGGAKGGREAAEIMVRGFLEGYYAKPESWGAQRRAAAVVDALNGWIHSLGRTDPQLDHMACTFTGLVLRGRTAHVLHVGDSRLYRLSGDRLSLLTRDHALDRPGMTHVLTRAIGLEPTVILDTASYPLALHERFLLCSDGVHGVLSDQRIAEILSGRKGPEETARDLTAAALESGASDNATALIADILALPPADREGLSLSLAPLPVVPAPKASETIDGFRLERLLSDGHYTRLFVATDQQEGGTVVLKFPKARTVTDATYRAAFLREAWVAARVRSPWLGTAIELAEGRQSRLYTVMPFYDGETLEHRLRRRPPLGLEEGRVLAVALCKAVASLHRAGIIHRDIKPDNVILCADGVPRLIDLGVVRVPGLEDLAPEAIPGTPSYMAPELFAGQPGDARSDLFALGVTLFRAFTGTYPYGEIEPFSHPRFGKPKSLAALRPDLPAWLDYTLGRTIAHAPEDRFADLLELAHELESGPMATANGPRRSPRYEANPLMFWQILSALLGLAFLVLLAHR